MNQLQLDRWKQVSLGFAKSYTNLTSASKSKLLIEVENCIEWVVCNGLESIEDWDRAIYKNEQLIELSAGSRVTDFIRDNSYEFECNIKHGTDVVTEKFGSVLGYCVRAGFDMAVAPSAGAFLRL